MKTETINLKSVKVFDLMDQPILLPTPFMRDLGNAIYVNYRDIERQDLGRKIFMCEKEGIELIMDESEIKMFIEVFDKVSTLPGILYNSIIEYLNNKISQLK